MEPSNLNPHPTGDDELDAQLRAHFSAPPLADDGFSAGVLAMLPAPGRNSVQLKRRFICAAGLMAGFAAAVIGLVKAEGTESTLTTLDRTLTVALTQLFTAPVGLAIALVVLCLGLAFRGQWRLLPRL